MKIRSRFYGQKDVQKRLRDLRDRMPVSFGKALYLEGLRIFVRSQVLVPVDTGRLRASGGVTEPKGGNNPFVLIYYGTVYAGIVHERHPTKSKYLEGPFLEALPTMASRIEADTLRLFGKGSLPPLPVKPPENTRLRDDKGRFKKKGT